MNKFRGKKILMLLIFLGIIYFPITIQADESSDNNSICGEKLGIKINVSDYQRVSRYITTGTYQNDITDRHINSISSKSSKGDDEHYKAYFYVGNINQLEKLDDLKNSTANDSNVEHYTIEFKGSLTYDSADADTKKKLTIPAGKEMIVIVTLIGEENAPKKSTCSTGKHSKIKYKDANGVEQTTYCCGGNFNKKNSDGTDVALSGVAASKFIQNPDGNSTLVDNLRKSDTSNNSVCEHVRNGQRTDFKNNFIADADSKINLTPDELAGWQSFYPEYISFCNDELVPFLIDETKLAKVYNKLLRFYKKKTELQNKGSSDYDSVRNTIYNTISGLSSNNYYISVNGSADPNYPGNPNVLSSNLQCDYKNLEPEYVDDTGTEGKYQSSYGQEKYLYGELNDKKVEINGENVNVCSTACYERLTVVYTPPKVVKAGMCFQYKVTIKSYNECGAKVSPEIDNILNGLKNKKMCSPNPVCGNNENSTQAGPSEEFDSCVTSCDGGEYSQKCINKCYKKVYEKKKNNVTKTTTNDYSTTPNFMINKIDSDNVMRLADSDDNETDQEIEYYDPDKVVNRCNTNTKIHRNKSYCAEYFYKAKLLNPMGRYNNDNGTITWNPESNVSDPKNVHSTGANAEFFGRQIARSSPFYTASEGAVEILIEDLWERSGRDDRRYYIDNNGFKVQVSIGGGWQCGEKCSYHGCGTDDALTSKQYTQDWINALDTINEALDDCNTTAACEREEKVTSFNISADSKGSKTGEKKTSMSGTNMLGSGASQKGSTTVDGDTCTADTSPSIFSKAKDPNMEPTGSSSTAGIFGRCYNENNGSAVQDRNGDMIDYQTTITFPGVYIKEKTGELAAACNRSTDEFVNIPQVFCSPYDQLSVNQAFATWHTMHLYSPGNFPNSFTPEENIHATLGVDSQGFGKHKWSINFSCFYAINNGGDNEDEPGCEKSGKCCYDADGNIVPDEECDKCEGDCCDGSCVQSLDYDVRIVDLSNLFPKSEDDSKVRLRGFNWGSGAKLNFVDSTTGATLGQDVTKGYDVDPVEYSKTVESKGESGTYTDSQLDFRITLDSDDIQKLKTLKLDFLGTYDFKNGEIIKGTHLYAYNMFGGTSTTNGLLSVKSKVSKYLVSGVNNSNG